MFIFKKTLFFLVVFSIFLPLSFINAADYFLPEIYIKEIIVEKIDRHQVGGKVIFINEDQKPFYRLKYQTILYKGDFNDPDFGPYPIILERHEGGSFDIMLGEKLSHNFLHEINFVNFGKNTLFISIFDQNNKFISQNFTVFNSNELIPDFFEIDPALASFSIDEQEIPFLAGIAVNEELAEKLKLSFQVKGVSWPTTESEVKVKTDTYLNDFPNLASSFISEETYLIKQDETIIDYLIKDPEITKPGSYLTSLYLIDPITNIRVSNIVEVRYVLEGSFAEILKLVSDKTSYEKGETIKITVDYIGSFAESREVDDLDESIIEIYLFDGDKLIKKEQKEAILSSVVKTEEIEVNVDKNIKNLKLEAKIIKNGEVLAEYSAREISETIEEEKTILLFLLIPLFLIIAIIIIFYFLKKKMPFKKFLFLFGLLIFALFLFLPSTDALACSNLTRCSSLGGSCGYWGRGQLGWLSDCFGTMYYGCESNYNYCTPCCSINSTSDSCCDCCIPASVSSSFSSPTSGSQYNPSATINLTASLNISSCSNSDLSGTVWFRMTDGRNVQVDRSMSVGSAITFSSSISAPSSPGTYTINCEYRVIGLFARTASPFVTRQARATGSCGSKTITVVSTVSPSNTLSVNSSGASSVSISSSVSDMGGTTNYTRTSSNNIATWLYAPSSHGSYQFSYWSGCSSVSGTGCYVSISGGSSRSVTAYYSYSAPSNNTLNVNSSGVSGVSIWANQSDMSGTTNYSRTSSSNIGTWLSAPLSHGSYEFSSWSGCDSTAGSPVRTDCYVSITNGSSKSVTANYSYSAPATNNWLYVNSSPVSGIQINASQSGMDGVSHYSRNIWGDINTWLYAPSSYGSYQFSHWSGCAGISGTGCYVSVTGGSNALVTANYVYSATNNTLNVYSSPVNGISITDYYNTGMGGTTDYSRQTTSEINTWLYAPSAYDNYQFSYWQGCSSVSGNYCYVSVTNGSSVSVRAYYDYAPSYNTLHVYSSPVDGISITDAYNTGMDGTTNYGKQTTIDINTYLYAPPSYSIYQFNYWQGCSSVYEENYCYVSVTNGSSVAVRAYYTISFSSPPPIPTNFSCSSIDYRTIDVSWDEAPGATGYSLHRCVGTDCTPTDQIIFTINNYWSDTNLSSNTTYRYRVKSYDSGSDLYSDYSPIITCLTRPDAPSNVSCEPVSSSQINVSWDEINNVTGYRILGCQGDGCTSTNLLQSITSQTTTSWAHQSLSPNTIYRYRLGAVNQAGVGRLSDFVTCNTLSVQSLTAAMSCQASCPGCRCSSGIWETYPSELFRVFNDSTPSSSITKSIWKINNATQRECNDDCDLSSFPTPSPIGNYNIELTVENESGFSDTATQAIEVKSDIEVDFECSLDQANWRTDCHNLVIPLDGTIYLRDISILSQGAVSVNDRTWSLNGQAKGTNREISIVLTEGGINAIKLFVRDNIGREGEETKEVNARKPLPQWKEVSPNY